MATVLSTNPQGPANTGNSTPMADAVPWVHLAPFRRGCFGGDRRVLGHFLAHVHRPGHLLDASPHRHPDVRNPRRAHLRLSDPLVHSGARSVAARCHGPSMEIPRGPLGAFIAAWGGATMLASAPFDNWWHNAYGLDVKIFSPPHVVLDGGVLAIQLGAVVMVSSAMNRSSEPLRRKLDWFLLLLGAMVTMLALTVVWESTHRVFMHTAQCYRAMAVVAPVVFAGVRGDFRQPAGPAPLRLRASTRPTRS